MSILGPILGIALPILGLGGVGAAIAFIPGAAAIAGKVVAGALAFLSKLPPWVFAVAAALLFSLWCLHGKHKAEAKIPALQAAAAAEHRAFVTEKASFDAAQAKIADNNNRIAAAAKELDREKQEAAANEARLNERWKSTQATVSALEADARDPKRKPCTVSDQARKGLEGL